MHMLILVIEQDQGLRELLAIVIEYAGHEVITATDEHSALHWWQRAGRTPQMIVADLDGLRGAAVAAFQALDQLRREAGAALLVLDPPAAGAAGVSPDATLPKPFNIDDLIATTDRLAVHHAARGEGPARDAERVWQPVANCHHSTQTRGARR